MKRQTNMCKAGDKSSSISYIYKSVCKSVLKSMSKHLCQRAAWENLGYTSFYFSLCHFMFSIKIVNYSIRQVLLVIFYMVFVYIYIYVPYFTFF